MDADILLDDSSATESEIECVSDMYLYHSTSREKENHTTTDTVVDIKQSNMGGEVPSMDHSKVFMKCMSMYMVRGSAGEEEGFKKMKDVANGVDHYEHYTGSSLTIEKSKLGRLCHYGCRIHENCPFHVSFNRKL